jgi:hypothetical protein
VAHLSQRDLISGNNKEEIKKMMRKKNDENKEILRNKNACK